MFTQKYHKSILINVNWNCYSSLIIVAIVFSNFCTGNKSFHNRFYASFVHLSSTEFPINDPYLFICPFYPNRNERLNKTINMLIIP